MKNEIYETRVIPFVKKVTKYRNGKPYTDVVDNLTSEERNSMSCKPRMLWERGDHVYMAELPLTFNEGTSVKWTLYYIFDELTEEEQKKYMDRSIIIRTTIKDVVQVYDKSPKGIFGRVKKRKK